MARIPVTVEYTLSRNNDEPTTLLVSALVIPSTDFRDSDSVDYPDGAIQELGEDGEPIGHWEGRLTAAEECELERAVLAAWHAEKECA